MKESFTVHIINFVIFLLLITYSLLVYDFYYMKIFNSNIVHLFAYFVPFVAISFFLTIYFLIIKVYKYSKIIFINLFLFIPVVIYIVFFVIGIMKP